MCNIEFSFAVIFSVVIDFERVNNIVKTDFLSLVTFLDIKFNLPCTTDAEYHDDVIYNYSMSACWI